MPRLARAAALLLAAAPTARAAPPDAGSAEAGPIPVAVEATEDGFRLVRGGEPYALRGVGGQEDLDLLASVGGTSIRTWGVGDETAALLDAAHARGLTVALGVWLGHERHGFDYDDPKQVAAQLEQVRKAVLAHRDHPALLLWGIGNEMEGFEQGDDPAIWRAVCGAAALVQELDPHHPVMTTTTEVAGGRVAAVNACGAIDVHGVNSYGGSPSMLQRYRDAGGSKPIVVTEYGPHGTWEVAKTPAGAPLEATSTAKADAYVAVARDVLTDPSVLGGYAFLWGSKAEGTPTWFGLLLPDGSRLGAVDALAAHWGRPVPNRAPTAEPLVGPTDPIDPGASVELTWSVADPEGDPLAVEYTLVPELSQELMGGDTHPVRPAVPGAIEGPSLAGVRVTLPPVPGTYRLLAVVRDDHGGAATASLPLQVGGPLADDAPRPVPWFVYRDAGLGGPWVPSGYMGDTEALRLDPAWARECASPPTCLQIVLHGTGWAGVAWQNPPGNWGQQDGGVDLSQAKRLTLKIKGDRPKTKITLGVGLIEGDQPHPDSLKASKDVTFGWEWTEVRIPLRGDRSSLLTGFWFVLPPQDRPGTVVYIDDVVFE